MTLCRQPTSELIVEATKCSACRREAASLPLVRRHEVDFMTEMRMETVKLIVKFPICDDCFEAAIQVLRKKFGTTGALPNAEDFMQALTEAQQRFVPMDMTGNTGPTGPSGAYSKLGPGPSTVSMSSTRSGKWLGKQGRRQYGNKEPKWSC